MPSKAAAIALLSIPILWPATASCEPPPAFAQLREAAPDKFIYPEEPKCYRCKAESILSEDRRQGIIAERNNLLMKLAGTFAFTQTGAPAGETFSNSYPPDIAAVVAWNVDDIAHTPSYVVEKDRRPLDPNESSQTRGMSRRSEIAVIQKALSELPGLPMKEAVLYTTLEPPPEVQTAILAAGITNIVYCLPDARLHDPYNHEPRYTSPSGINAIHLAWSDRPEAKPCDGHSIWFSRELWDSSPNPGSSPVTKEWAINGVFDFMKFLRDQAFFDFPKLETNPFEDQMKADYCENQELKDRIRDIFGSPIMDGTGDNYHPQNTIYPFDAARTIYFDGCPNGLYRNGRCIYPRMIPSRTKFCRKKSDFYTPEDIEKMRHQW